MERLTDNALPLTTFKRCQLCGYESPRGDICEFQMWLECDENDQPEDKILIACEPCKKSRIDPHIRGYYQVPWGVGGLDGYKPGRFMLLCGDCTWRDGITCTHPELVSNGGGGMMVTIAQLPIHNLRVCFTDGTSRGPVPGPANSCAGQSLKEE